MSGSLVERLRESVKACRALDRSQLLSEAANEIERLRLAADERHAIERLVDAAETYSPQWAAPLRRLLERTGGER